MSLSGKKVVIIGASSGMGLATANTAAEEDLADAVLFLMQNGFTTGTVLHVDGGHRLI